MPGEQHTWAKLETVDGFFASRKCKLQLRRRCKGYDLVLGQDFLQKNNIVIVGGGIIGCTSAYYITRHPAYDPSTTTVTVLEASSVDGGASGKAGGLIAKWAFQRELVDIKFGEHEKLAKEHDGAARWGWRYTGVGQWEGR